MKLSGESGAGGPSLDEAFPTAFMRTSPSVYRKSPIIQAASLLRYHSIEAALVLVDEILPMKTGSKFAFVSGYSILNVLHKTHPDDSYKALFGACERFPVWMESVSSDRTLRDLLTAFNEGRFGFTVVTKEDMFATVGLSDVLELYQTGMMGSDLTVGEVASQPIALDKETSVREALNLMIEKRIRRVFVRGTSAYVSDRELVSSIFSPRRLKEARYSPKATLEGTLLEAGPVDSFQVEDAMPLREAAQMVGRLQGGAITCENGVVTPWDVVMKPFATGHLNVS